MRIFSYPASAAQPGIQQPKRRLPVTKQGYPDAAKKYTATCKAAERNARASKSSVWEQDFLFLEKLTGGTSEDRPSSALLPAILAYGLLRQCFSPLVVHGSGDAAALSGEDHRRQYGGCLPKQYPTGWIPDWRQ
jgi:hypothetical protein